MATPGFNFQPQSQLLNQAGNPLVSPQNTLEQLMAQLGPGMNPMGNSLPKPPLALNAGPQPSTMGARFAAGSSGVDDLLAGGAKAGGSAIDDIARLALPAAGQTATSVLSSAPTGVQALLSKFKNPMAGGSGVKGLAKASLPGLAGSIAGNYIGNEVGGTAGGLISGVATGAGIGSIFGVPGAIGGGILGGALSLFGGDDNKAKPEEKLTEFITKAGMDSTMADSYMLQFEILKSTTGDENAALAAVGQQIVTDMQQQQQQAEQQQKMLATQALTAQFFQPFTKQLLDSAQQRASIGEQLAADLPPEYRSIAQSANAASLDNATRTANAYAAQAQLLPQMAALEWQQGIANQLAQQQTQAVMQQVAGAGGGSNVGGGLQQILAQLSGG